MHLDNSACNLASLNLLAFLHDDGEFDVEGYKAAVEVAFTAQEILVGNADYPTEKIADTSRKFRQLGLGYANLGALLMALGMPYDSDSARAWAGALTALAADPDRRLGELAVEDAGIPFEWVTDRPAGRDGESPAGRALREIVEEVLEIAPVRPGDDFLALGGGATIVLYVITSAPRSIGIGLIIAALGIAMEFVGVARERRLA